MLGRTCVRTRPSLCNKCSWLTGTLGKVLHGLTHCIHLSTLSLWYPDQLNSWGEVVAILCSILSPLRSPMLHDLSLLLELDVSSLSSDDDFTIDLGPIHALQVQESLQSLGNIDFDFDVLLASSNASTMTQEYVENAVRRILEPWNERGILNIQYGWYGPVTNGFFRHDPHPISRKKLVGGERRWMS